MTAQGARETAGGVATAALLIALALPGCESTTTAQGPRGVPAIELSAIEAVAPRPESGGVDLIPTFAWRIPGRSNRVSGQIWNLYRADNLDGDADFVRVFQLIQNDSVQRFRLNEGQEGMPAMGIGRLRPDTDYVWRLAISYWDEEGRVDTGEWRFRTAPE